MVKTPVDKKIDFEGLFNWFETKAICEFLETQKYLQLFQIQKRLQLILSSHC